MPYLLTSALIIFRKDFKVELRTRENITTILPFSVVIAFIFNFTFDPSPQLMATIGPGIIWVAFIFSGTLGINRLFLTEREIGTLEALNIAPIHKESIFLGKFLGILILLLSIQSLLIPVFLILYNLNLFELRYISITVCATIGFSAVGTLFSAIAVSTKAREIMLPVLFLPVILPIVIASVAATQKIFTTEGWHSLLPWLQLIIFFDFLYLVLCSILFESVIEE